ncbi:hypothetical protein GCM10027429_11120 [Marivirga atlantica]|jgi:hypothetical protein|uniref:Uncharacterized protein n=1 Tax=Marivirga atlantica TaxID=1548457 RepID=A0A937A6X3_9BACT|nr:hypothetical protein [Marivirga atlantica]MBL0764725.1 hypothetical protein [Marivirga atlantica]
MHLKLTVFISLFLILLNQNTSFGQADFKAGFIVNHVNDTIYGLIDYRGDLMMAEKCRFKQTKEANIEIYLPADINAYKFLDGKYYVSKSYKGKQLFLEFLVNGELDVFYYRDKAGDHYLVEKENKELTELPYSEGTRMQNDVEYAFKSTKHIGLLSIYTEDAPEIHQNIQNLKEPNHKGLINIAKKYHEQVCTDGSECIVFEKQLPLFSLGVELFVGNVTLAKSLRKEVDSEIKYFLQQGVLLHLWMPRTNEKLFFKTGLQRLHLKLDESGETEYKIPIHFQYVFPKWKVRPTASYGINFYVPAVITNSFNIGSQFLITDKLRINLIAEAEFFGEFVPFIPAHLFYYSFNGGLMYKF